MPSRWRIYTKKNTYMPYIPYGKCNFDSSKYGGIKNDYESFLGSKASKYKQTKPWKCPCPDLDCEQEKKDNDTTEILESKGIKVCI